MPTPAPRRCAVWGQRDRLITRESFDAMCTALGQPTMFTVPGSHSWMLADPDAFGEIMTNVLELVGTGSDVTGDAQTG
jgi:hypothetical protein